MQTNRESLMDLDNIVLLIDKLYSNALKPDEINTVQSQLQRFQKNDKHALPLADELLNNRHYSLYCKYFGALTYTVKLNQIFSSIKVTELEEEDDEDLSEINSILALLKAHLNQLRLLFDEYINQGVNNVFVLKKIYSNLSLIYMNCFSLWKSPILLLIELLRDGSFNIQTSLQGFPNMERLNVDSNAKLEEQIILFSEIIIEDILKKVQSPSNQLDSSLKFEIFKTADFFLVKSLTNNDQNFDLSVNCLSSWINYFSFTSLRGFERINIDQILKLLIDKLVQDQNNASFLLPFFVSLFENHFTFINNDIKLLMKEVVLGSWGFQFINKNYEADLTQFVTLMILVLDINIQKMKTLLIIDDSNSSNAQIVSTLLKLTNYPGIPIVEDEISKELIDFWLEICDTYIDESYETLSSSSSDDSLIIFANRFCELMFEVFKIYWVKCQLPFEDPGLLHELQLNKEEYYLFRRDVGDFVDNLYSIIPLKILSFLFENIANDRQNNNIKEIECSIYFLNVIFENLNNLDDDNDVDDDSFKILTASSNDSQNNDIKIELTKRITALFKNSFLDFSLSTNNKYLLSTVVKFLTKIEFFYKIHTEYLTPILDYLMNLLLNYTDTKDNRSSNDPPNNTFEFIIVKSISSICDECRVSLHNYLYNFEPLLKEILSNETLTPFTREKLVNSVTCIIQSIELPSEQANGVCKMLQLIFDQIDFSKPLTEKRKEYLLSLLNSTLEIGKAMQLPTDEFYDPSTWQLFNQYWINDPMKMRDLLLEIINLYCVNLPIPLVVETCCSLFRIGLSESISNPFVFEDKIIIEFIVSMLNTLQRDGLKENSITSITYLLNLLETLIISNYRTLDSLLIQDLFTLLVFENESFISSDLDIFTAFIQVINSTLDKKPDLLMSNHQNFLKIIQILLFSLSQTKEKFLIKGISTFFVTLMVLKSGNKANHEMIKNLFLNESLGSNLTCTTFEALVKTTRSNLEYYSEILRYLLIKYQLDFKGWSLQFFQKDINNNSTYPKIEFETFYKKMVLTKTPRTSFQQTIKDLWSRLNGLDYI